MEISLYKNKWEISVHGMLLFFRSQTYYINQNPQEQKETRDNHTRTRPIHDNLAHTINKCTCKESRKSFDHVCAPLQEGVSHSQTGNF